MFLRKYSEFIIKWRYLVVVFTILAAFFAASGGEHLVFNNDYRVFFDKDNPQLVAYSEIQSTYTKNDNVLIALTPKDGNVFTPKTLSAVLDLTKRAWQTPYSVRVDSIANFQHTSADGDSLEIDNLVGPIEGLSAQDIEKIQQIATNEPELVNRLVSKSGHLTAINVTTKLPGIDMNLEVPEIANYTRELVAYAKETYPDIEFHVTGIVMMNNAFAEASQADLVTLVPLSLVCILFIVFLFVGGIFRILCVFLVVVFTIFTALGAVGWFGVDLTSPLMSLIPIVLTLAVADCVHLLVTWVQEVRKGKDKHEAIIESLRVNFMPVFFTSVTTAIGFLALNFSDSPPFRHLGNFSAIGVIAAFLYSISFLPAMIAILPCKIKPDEGKSRFPKIMNKLADFVLANQRKLLISGAAITVVFTLGILKNTPNDNFVEYFNESLEFRVDTEYVSNNLGGVYFAEYSIRSGENGGVSSPKFMAQVEEFVRWLETQPEVINVNSIMDTMKRLNKDLHNGDESWYKLPEEQDLASQYLLLYEMSLPYGLDLNNQIDITKSLTKVTVSLKILSNTQVFDFEERVFEWMKVNTPEIATYGGSTTLMFSHIALSNIKSMLVGTSIALVIISLLLVLVFKSVGYGLLSLIPNLIPVAIAFGIWGLLVSEVGMSLSFVMAVAMGIVVDDTIHFMSKYLRAIREQGLDAEEAVRYAFSSVGVALWITSLGLIVGFLLLGTSAFKINADMGIMTSMIIAFALIADFLFLPPLLIWISKKYKLVSVQPETSVAGR